MPSSEGEAKNASSGRRMAEEYEGESEERGVNVVCPVSMNSISRSLELERSWTFFVEEP